MSKRPHRPAPRAPEAPRWEKGVSWAAIAAAFVAAEIAYHPWGVSFGSDRPALALGLAALALALPALARSARGRDGVPDAVAASLAAVAAVVIVSTAVSPYRLSALFGMPNSAQGALQLLAAIALVLGAASFSSVLRDTLLEAVPYLVVAQLASSAVQVLQGREPTGTLANSTQLGQVLIVCLPLLAGSVFDASGRLLPVREARLPWAFLMAALAALVVGQAMNAVLVAVGWLGWQGWRLWRREGEKRRRLPVWAWAAAAAAGGWVAWQLADSSVWRAFWRYRALYWSASAKVAATHPVLGVGPDVFREAVAPIASPLMLETGRQGIAPGFGQLSVDPHNIVVTAGLYLGLAGLIVLLWAVWAAVSAWRRDRGEHAGQDWFAQAAVLYVLTLLTAPAALPTLPLFCLVLGASLVREQPGATSPRDVAAAPLRRIALSATLAIGCAAALVALALATTQIWLGNRWQGFAPPEADAALAAADAWRYDPYLYYVASWRLASAGGGTDAAGRDLSAIQRAVELAPFDPVYALELARTLASGGAPADVTRGAYERAISLFPASMEANAAYARYLAASGEPVDARRYVRSALGAGPREPAALQAAADVAEASGETTLAARYRAQAEQVERERSELSR